MKYSNEELKKRCKIGDPKKCDWRAKYFGVPFVLPFTKPLLRIGFQAEGVCFLWIILGIFAGVLYGFGNYFLGILALLLYHISWILDGVDGAIARYRKRPTIRGVYLDLIGHTIVKSVILLGMGIGSYINPPSYIPISSSLYLLAGGIAAVFMINNNVARLKVYETLLDSRRIKELVSKREIFKPGVRRDFKNSILNFLRMNPLSLFYIATLFNIIPLFILFYAILLPIMFFMRVYKEYFSIKKEIDEQTNKE